MINTHGVLFKQHILDCTPDMIADGYTYSWYHGDSPDFCTTIFASYKRPPKGFPSGCWKNPVIVDDQTQFLSDGTYCGVYGAWLLTKARPELRAPYEESV